MSDHRETIFEHGDHPVASVGSILTTFAGLAVLALVALAVGFNYVGPYKVVFSLAIAAVQAGVLSVYFMDLRYADKLTWLIAGSGIFWVGLLFLFTITDYLTRHLAAY